MLDIDISRPHTYVSLPQSAAAAGAGHGSRSTEAQMAGEGLHTLWAKTITPGPPTHRKPHDTPCQNIHADTIVIIIIGILCRSNIQQVPYRSAVKCLDKSD